VAPRRGDPIGNPTWSRSVFGWDQFEAGGLTAAEAEAVLRELLTDYAADKQTAAASR
jgi:hypothetical protein